MKVTKSSISFRLGLFEGNMMITNKKKIKNSFDFLRGREKTRVSIFLFEDAGKLCVNPGAEWGRV